MDFRRPFDDAIGARDPRHVLERQLLAHAHAAKQLDGAVDDAADHLRALHFHHRAVEPDVAVAAVDTAGEPVDGKPHGLHLLIAVGDPELYGLAVGELAAEGRARVGLLDHHGEAAPRQAQTAGGDFGAADAQTALQR